ncbi:chromosome-associated kinesin KIF4 isoform X2 [Lingula anatina]|uniref:Kinesin-like protein n=1 Tax=Lingula anatina TaxID=7574 RepID=A0A1S3HIK1_LINAN|nr:chromosome-associated kinesin KIF4 isoform X2 [Lingula anatina]|eukprot:XP_013384839.1 chromosome-associated kinesin KIF4 isoform X2 [Lingula anatina]
MPSETTQVKVVVKARPLLEVEETKGGKNVVKISGDKISVDTGGKEQTFVYDGSFAGDVKANQLYKDRCEPLLQKALEGYNVSIMAFGATGSGKSHLMSGTEDDPGIVPCLNHSLYKHVEEKAGKKEFFITVTFVEILDEQMTDLLNPHSNEMRVRQHPQLGIYVDGLSELVANDGETLAKLYEQGSRARKMGATDVRAHRARSHSIFTIHVDQKESNSSKVGLKSTIQMVDLAGSEGVDSNSSLQAVARVIAALGDSKKKGGHVPYRDSRITRLLQEAFGGNAFSLMFACISPADLFSQETMVTLQYATLARNIKNEARVNLDETTHIIADLREEIARLRDKLTTNSKKEDVMKMEDLIHDLQIAKRQTWEEKQRLSIQYEEERKTNLANKGILEWVMDSMRKGDKEMQEKLLLLQKEKDQLMLQYKEKRKAVDGMKEDLQKKIAEYSKMADSGKATDASTKAKVTAIHELKELLKSESERLKEIKQHLKEVTEKQRTEREDARSQNMMLRGNAELRQAVEIEERKKIEMENAIMVEDEMERVGREVDFLRMEIQNKVEQGKQYSSEEGSKLEIEVAELKAERQVIALQQQVLEQEKARLQRTLDDAYKHHKEETEILQLQNFQTFRNYREVFEQQKSALEQRYRGLLEDAVQDAVFMSSRNAEMVEENQSLRQEIAELKDRLTVLEGQAAAN